MQRPVGAGGEDGSAPDRTVSSSDLPFPTFHPPKKSQIMNQPSSDVTSLNQEEQQWEELTRCSSLLSCSLSHSTISKVVSFVLVSCEDVPGRLCVVPGIRLPMFYTCWLGKSESSPSIDDTESVYGDICCSGSV
ncbi:hypothetical protein EYF80_042922 [Liparis tanakae]|uniref:Uncharacterized protein n=1 Tax=Liparis tanakae TaxID=230148 RepID=A0A4Z2FZW5_9TELE|nr:hypothetical protein EYF80_042922 [Liparis tanakae]